MAVTYFGIDIVKWLHNLYKKRDEELNEVIFMRQKQCTMCARHRRNVNCTNEHCYNYTAKNMKAFIDSAQHSLYIAVNVFTSVDLGKVVLNAHRRGVSVKILGNNGTAYLTGSQLSMLHENGIAVKVQGAGNDVHHKFCLIDVDIQTKKRKDKPLHGARTIPSNGILITGSMNWTYQVTFIQLNFEI
ncbi:Mitochondrial cardiolipin hydrolase [Pseudolycoriella hygida]|uniref:Mitochondrial cardiolipin hydrolase n=1 Tax=Pseudolycoriella hygida TaxID=35572 RepID=A0A9Q0N1F6_9DIPT|nr:Mitochondrial cardiolipin hydrolase [Pseudolycoriella hygida]